MATTMPAGEFSLPDPSRAQSDEGNWVTHLSVNGNVHFLVHHFGREDTTIYGGRLYIVPRPGPPSDHLQVPDLLIAFDVDSSLYYQSNGYIISEQGKPPDFVLEVESESTAEIDLGPKRDDYAAFGIPECWRFDETGEYYGDRLAGGVLLTRCTSPSRPRRSWGVCGANRNRRRQIPTSCAVVLRTSPPLLKRPISWRSG